MESIVTFLESLLPSGFEIEMLLKAAVVLIAGVLVLGLVGRLLFGKKSVLSQSVSSAISILFIYAVTVVIYSLGVDLKFLVSPLPFVTIRGEYMEIFQYEGVHYTVICDQILGMVILSFLANLTTGWLPTGKKLFSWIFFRALSVLLAMILHLIANAIITSFLPEGLLTWAPVILLGLLITLMLVGGLKLLVGAVLTTVNPLIGILYTFFFANVVGKQLSKAVLTTVIISAIVFALNSFGVTSVFIASAALVAYIPFVLLLLVAWYIVGHLL